MDSILWLMEFNKHPEYWTSNTSWCDFFFWVTQNVASIWAVKRGCVCSWQVWVQLTTNWWFWAVTWVWDTCDSVRRPCRDKRVFAERLRLPDGWNWRVLSCDLHCWLSPSWRPSVCPEPVSQSVSCVASLFLSPLLSPSPTCSFSSRVCARSSRRARRCCASSRGSSCATTACMRGAGGRPRRCGRVLCPWRSVGREPPPSASATASCVVAPDSQSPSPTDWPRRRPWWRGDAAIFAFVPSAGASRDWGCVRQRPRGLSLLPHTVTRA